MRDDLAARERQEAVTCKRSDSMLICAGRAYLHARRREFRAHREWRAGAASPPSTWTIGEDGAQHSFAGMHASVLGVASLPALEEAVRRIHASADPDAV